MCNSCEAWYKDKVEAAKDDLTPRGRAVTHLAYAIDQLEWLSNTEDTVEEVKRIIREEC